MGETIPDGERGRVLYRPVLDGDQIPSSQHGQLPPTSTETLRQVFATKENTLSIPDEAITFYGEKITDLRSSKAEQAKQFAEQCLLEADAIFILSSKDDLDAMGCEALARICAVNSPADVFSISPPGDERHSIKKRADQINSQIQEGSHKRIKLTKEGDETLCDRSLWNAIDGLYQIKCVEAKSKESNTATLSLSFLAGDFPRSIKRFEDFLRALTSKLNSLKEQAMKEGFDLNVHLNGVEFDHHPKSPGPDSRLKIIHEFNQGQGYKGLSGVLVNDDNSPSGVLVGTALFAKQLKEVAVKLGESSCPLPFNASMLEHLLNGTIGDISAVFAGLSRGASTMPLYGEPQGDGKNPIIKLSPVLLVDPNEIPHIPHFGKEAKESIRKIWALAEHNIKFFYQMIHLMTSSGTTRIPRPSSITQIIARAKEDSFYAQMVGFQVEEGKALSSENINAGIENAIREAALVASGDTDWMAQIGLHCFEVGDLIGDLKPEEDAALISTLERIFHSTDKEAALNELKQSEHQSAQALYHDVEILLYNELQKLIEQDVSKAYNEHSDALSVHKVSIISLDPASTSLGTALSLFKEEKLGLRQLRFMIRYGLREIISSSKTDTALTLLPIKESGTTQEFVITGLAKDSTELTELDKLLNLLKEDVEEQSVGGNLNGVLGGIITVNKCLLAGIIQYCGQAPMGWWLNGQFTYREMTSPLLKTLFEVYRNKDKQAEFISKVKELKLALSRTSSSEPLTAATN